MQYIQIVTMRACFMIRIEKKKSIIPRLCGNETRKGRRNLGYSPVREAGRLQGNMNESVERQGVADALKESTPGNALALRSQFHTSVRPWHSWHCPQRWRKNTLETPIPH